MKQIKRGEIYYADLSPIVLQDENRTQAALFAADDG